MAEGSKSKSEEKRRAEHKLICESRIMQAELAAQKEAQRKAALKAEAYKRSTPGLPTPPPPASADKQPDLLAEYRDIVAKMLERTPEQVPSDVLKRILRVHGLYTKRSAEMDDNTKTLLVAIVVEQSGLV